MLAWGGSGTTSTPSTRASVAPIARAWSTYAAIPVRRDLSPASPAGAYRQSPNGVPPWLASLDAPLPVSARYAHPEESARS